LEEQPLEELPEEESFDGGQASSPERQVSPPETQVRSSSHQTRSSVTHSDGEEELRDDGPFRQESLYSLGPANFAVTNVPLGRKDLPRRTRLPNDLHRKSKELLQDLQALLVPLGGPRHTNVEFCMQSACNVLHHLCLTADLDLPVLAESSSQACTPQYTRSRSKSSVDPMWSRGGNGSSSWGTPSHSPMKGHPPQQLPQGSLEDATDAMDHNRSDHNRPCYTRSGTKDSVRSGASSMDFGHEMTSSRNKCYIHPERPFRMSWDFCAMMLILTLSVVVPLEVCFFWDADAPPVLSGFANFLDIFFILDIFMNFLTAFHEGHGISGRLVTDFKGIAKHYAKGWLWIDLVASFPWLWVTEIFDADRISGTADPMGMLKVLRYAKVARMMKVLRVLKLGSLMQMVEEKMVAAQSMTVAFQLLKMTVVMLIISHNVACAWYAVAIFVEDEPTTWLKAQGLDEASEVRQYVAAFYFAITTGTTVGYGDIHPENTIEQVVTVFVLVLSVAYIGQFLARVSQMISSLKQFEAQMAQAKRDALLFMKKRAVPKELQYKVLRYIEHVFETDAVTGLDEKIMNLLSESLKNQLALAVTGNVLKQFPLFEDVEEAFLTAICQVCRTQRAGVGDTMVAEEQVAHEMFWVVRGEAAVMRLGRQVGGLRVGDWFGELSLFFPGAVRKASVRCETMCEFLVLHNDDFQREMESFPKVRRMYEKVAAGIRKGNPRALEIVRSDICGSAEHFTRDCPRASEGEN